MRPFSGVKTRFWRTRKVRYCSAHAGEHQTGRSADVAQLVERNLAKVKVAGSSPVVRSEMVLTDRACVLGGVAERRGNGLQSRVHGFESRLHLEEPFTGFFLGRLAQR